MKDLLLPAAIFVILAYLVFAIADSSFIPEINGTAVVEGKSYHWPTKNESAYWTVSTEMDGKRGYTRVSEKTFDHVSIGDKVEIVFGYGRYTGLFYLKEVSLCPEKTRQNK